VLRPRLDAHYANEQIAAFTVTNCAGGVVDIGDFAHEQLRIGLGATIERRLGLDDELFLTPRLGVDVGVAGMRGPDLFGSASLGGTLSGQGDWSVDGSLDVNADSNGLTGVSTRIGVQGPF
jgi:hypothetical protein